MPGRSLAPRPLATLALAALLLATTAACSKDEHGSAATSSSTSITVAKTPAEVLATCTPAVGADFVAVERHLLKGAHQLREGFVSPDAADGHYLAADVYSDADQLLASDLRWRISPDGSAMAANPETATWSALPQVPAAEVVAHPELTTCVHAALALR